MLKFLNKGLSITIWWIFPLIFFYFWFLMAYPFQVVKFDKTMIDANGEEVGVLTVQEPVHNGVVNYTSSFTKFKDVPIEIRISFVSASGGTYSPKNMRKQSRMGHNTVTPSVSINTWKPTNPVMMYWTGHVHLQFPFYERIITLRQQTMAPFTVHYDGKP